MRAAVGWNRGVALLLALLLVLGTGCQRREETGERTQVLRYVNYSHIDAIDPQALATSAEYTVACHVLEGLMRIYQYTLRYGVAERYEISEDGCTYRFFLRQDACYSDGTPVQAADFQRTLRRMAVEHYVPSQLGLIENAEEVHSGQMPPEQLSVWTDGARTLCIRLKHPAAQFLQILALPAYAPTRADGTGTLRPQDCNGPFVLTGPEENGVLAMARNIHYWDRAEIRLDRVEAVAMSDFGAAYDAFQRGEVHVVPLPLEGEVETSGGVVRQVQTGILEYLRLACGTDSPLRSQALRQALNYGLNRKKYVESLGSDRIEPWARCVQPEIPGVRRSYVEEFPDTLYPLEGDARKAADRMSQALDELGLEDPSEIRLVLAVHNDSWSIREGETVARQWEEGLGISVRLAAEENPSDAQSQPGEGVVLLEGGIGEYGDPVVYLEDWARSPDWSWSARGTALAQCLTQAAVQSDRSIRLNCLFQAEELLLEEAPVVPLQIRSERLLVDRSLNGFETSTILAGGGYEFLYGYFS